MMRHALPIGLLCLWGCTTDNAQSLSILQNQSVSQASNGCVPTTAQSSTTRSIGVLDVSLVEAGAEGYNVYPLVRNNLVSRSSVPAAVDEITVIGLDVELEPDATLALVLPETSRKFFSGSLGGAIAPTQMLALAALAVPRPAALQMAAAVDDVATNFSRVIVHMRAVGKRTSDTVRSNWVTFHVSLCRGCLTGTVGVCPATGYDATDVKKGGCGVAQDEEVTCCYNETNALLCGEDVPQTG